MVRALALALAACGGATLQLDGPEQVRVDRLGPVDGPRARLSDGARPSGVVWTAQPPSVARVEDGRVIAEGAGEAQVTGTWQGQTVAWTLRVVPPYELVFRDVPAEVRVGHTFALQVSGRRGDQLTRATELAFSSSDPTVLEVSPDGDCRAVGGGLAYVTVTGHGSTAMAEILVR